MSLTQKAVFVTCFLSVTSPGVKAGSVTMKLMSHEDTGYIRVRFTERDFRQLYLCMSMNSTSSCLIDVDVFYRRHDAFTTRVAPRHAGINNSLSDYFTCVYLPAVTKVVCHRLDTSPCQSNKPYTSFRLQNPCCHTTCVGFVWNDSTEEIIHDGETLKICSANCTSLETTTEKLLPISNETNRRQPAKIFTKEAGNSDYDSSPTVIVSTVVATIIAADIMVVIVFILHKKCNSHRNNGDIKNINKPTINTNSFRTLSSDLTTEYVNTDQSRVYSSLDFTNEVATDQHLYSKIEASSEFPCDTNEKKENIYEDSDISILNEVPNTEHYINSCDTTENKQEDRTYSTIADSNASFQELKSGTSEVNKPSAKRCVTAEDSYIYFKDESVDESVKADTEFDGNVHCHDSKICDTVVYINTEDRVSGESQLSEVGQDTEYTNIFPRRITIRL